MTDVILYIADLSSTLSLPYADQGTPCGFPSPAQDYVDKSLDLNRELIDHPAATYYVKVIGQSMIGAGINDGDIAVVDISLDARAGDIVVAFLDGEHTIKYYCPSHLYPGVLWLKPANKNYNPIRVTPSNNFRVFGVVTKVIKNIRRGKG